MGGGARDKGEKKKGRGGTRLLKAEPPRGGQHVETAGRQAREGSERGGRRQQQAHENGRKEEGGVEPRRGRKHGRRFQARQVGNEWQRYISASFACGGRGGGAGPAHLRGCHACWQCSFRRLIERV